MLLFFVFSFFTFKNWTRSYYGWVLTIFEKVRRNFRLIHNGQHYHMYDISMIVTSFGSKLPTPYSKIQYFHFREVLRDEFLHVRFFKLVKICQFLYKKVCSNLIYVLKSFLQLYKTILQNQCSAAVFTAFFLVR